MKKFILLVSILALTLGLFAAEVIIGTGTSTQRFPLGSFWGYERSAALYTAAEIGAQNTRISAVSWYSSIATTATVPTKIYLKTTANSTLTTDTWANMISGATLLYDQSYTGHIAGGWNLFTLNGAFDLDMGSNLVILVERNYGGGGSSDGGSSGGGGIYSSTVTGAHLTWNADNSAPTGNGSVSSSRPNVTISYSIYANTTAPNPATISSPSNGAINVERYATLNWGSGGGAPTGYYLSLGTNNPPTNILNNMDQGNALTYNPGDLAYSTTYYWQVVPYNAFGSAAACPVWSFTVRADPAIYSLPWTESFENGNANNTAIMGWTQEAITGTSIWTANNIETTYNRSPRTGTWNAYLRYGNNRWIFKPVALQAGIAYRTVVYARQDGATPTDATLTISYGTAGNAGAMLNTILAPTALMNSDYQRLEGNFTPTADATYYIGIRGEINYSPWYISIDDVTIEEVPAGAPVAPILTYPALFATGLPVEGFELAWAFNSAGGIADSYTVYLSQDESLIYDDYVINDIVDTFYNPVDAGITFDYLQRWYWAVEAVNNYGSAVSDASRFDIIGAPAQIAINPVSFSETLELGESSAQLLTIENAGGLPLNFRIGFEETTARTLRSPVIGDIVSSASAVLNAERNPLATNSSIDASRAQLDLQFAYPTVMNTGEYGVASDGEFIYTSRWSSTAGSLQIYKYDLAGNYLAEIIIAGANGVRDLAYDGTYFYGAAAATTIYKMDFNTATLIGTITAPVPVRAITYDSDSDAFWVSNNWADPLQLIDHSGAVLRTLDTAATDFAGMAYDGLSGTPSIWVNSQIGDIANTLVQVSLDDGSILQSLTLNDTIIPGITVTGSAGGVEIISGIVPGTATILGMHQNQAIYGFELCAISSWVTANPRSGSVAINGSDVISIDFDANNIAPGLHTGIFTISHNAVAEPVVIPVSLTVTGEWSPIYAITPLEWDFTDVEHMNSATKEFTIQNNGGPGLIIATGGIYISDDAEGNFAVMANDLPVDLPYNANYRFNVLFTPQSLGAKTATLIVVDNLDRVLHSYPLFGNGIDEPIGQVVNLTATVQDLNDVMLSWGIASNDPGEPGWLHYDNGINHDGIGSGQVGTFNVAVKYTGADLWNYAGMQIEKIKFFPVSGNTNYSLRIWTGSDIGLAPTTLMYSQAVVLPTSGTWTEVMLDTPFPITQGEAIWFGYYCDVMDGLELHPAGCDAGPAVVGKGDLIELGGTWYSMNNEYALNYNWNLQAYVNDPLMPNANASQWLNIPVRNLEPNRDVLRKMRLSTSGNPNPSQRVLRGFNIYRDGLLINASPVATYAYLDQGLSTGIYEYAVQPLYYSTTGDLSTSVLAEILPPPNPFVLPFTEDWASADFATNMWTPEGSNWLINSTTGSPAPSVSFSWSPQVLDYSIPLTSYEFDATGIDNVQFSFDLFLNNYSIDAENAMMWEIWDGSTWNLLGGYSSLDDDLDWSRFSYDISAYASNRIFKIRFIASGEDSYEINYWYIDNITVAELPTTVNPVTDLSIANDGTTVTLSWTAVPGASWYMIYASEDPYTGFFDLGFVETAGVSLPAALLPVNKAFVKVTAGAGPFPRANLLFSPTAK